MLSVDEELTCTDPQSCVLSYPVLDDHQNPRLIKDLLQDLSSTLCILVRGVGKSVLVGNSNIWVCRLETVLAWQQQLQNLQMTKVGARGPDSRVRGVRVTGCFPVTTGPERPVQLLEGFFLCVFVITA